MQSPNKFDTVASRRQFLRTSGAFALGFSGLHAFMGCNPSRTPLNERFGPLVSDPAGIMDLPSGFSYRIVSRVGDQMNDGFYVPGAPDGMAAFEGPSGQTIVVRNHEVNPGADPAVGAFGPDNALLSRLETNLLYDAGADGNPALGGTTTFVYDTARQELVSQYLSLAGTLRNCAGGPTPWNTWITCEEITTRAGEDGAAKDHGYAFQVPASATPTIAFPEPLRAMGRFNREAVAVDPATNIIYQTEDTHDGLIYRFIPDDPSDIAAGGRLQVLRVRDQASLDTRNWDAQTVSVGTELEIDWLDIEDVEAPLDDLRLRGFDQGAARFARGEGMWYGNGAVYFACTNGGKAECGQIWRLIPDRTLELFIEPNDPGLIENADNLTVTPWGDLIVCEDGSNEQFLVGVTPEGELYKFARNAVSNSELAGATFSPDGTTLFVNIQHDGLTLAITGQWV